MATALKVSPAPPVVCAHPAFVPYREIGDSTDDTITMLGRCPDEDVWLELWISRTTGEIWNERALDSAEIADLRRAVWF